MNRESPSGTLRVRWLVIHSTPDEWEARLIRTALINEHIRCKLQARRLPTGEPEYALLVQSPDEREAQDVVNHVLTVLASQPTSFEEPSTEASPEESPIEVLVSEDAASESSRALSESPPSDIPRASPTAHESVVVASREGVGEIVHHIGRGFELRVGPRPYYIVEESRWEEFTDFSAQRQEFSILLRAEYTNLFRWIKENKLMGEFIKLVESTYRDVPPPRRSRRQTQPGIPVNPSAVASVALAVFGALSALMMLPWFVQLGLGLAALGCGLIGRYQIGSERDKQRGTLLAMLGVGIACIVIAMALVSRHTIQSPPVGHRPPAVVEMA